MGVIGGVIKYLILVAIVGTMVYARGLYLELKETQGKLQKAQETIKDLKEELQEAYKTADNTKKGE